MLRKLTFFLSLPFLFFFVAQPFVVATKTSNLPAVATKNGILQDFNAILRRRGHVKKIAQAKRAHVPAVPDEGDDVHEMPVDITGGSNVIDLDDCETLRIAKMSLTPS